MSAAIARTARPLAAPRRLLHIAIDWMLGSPGSERKAERPTGERGNHLALPNALPLPLAEATRALNAWIEIDLDALRHNAAGLRRVLGSTELIAVVKANAYGAGADAVARELETSGAHRFAVVWVSEGIALREAGVTRPILVLGHSFPEDAAQAVSANLTLTCHSLALGEALSREAVAQGRHLPVHVKVDTGLHRFGVPSQEAIALANALRPLPGIVVEGLTTHMANADEEDDSFADQQHATFARAAAELPWIPYRHTANSATALRRPELQYDGVRVGLALHGVLPPNTTGPALRPILALRARLGRVADVAPGEGVSYGLTWRADTESRVGLVPIGYADGWPRRLGNAGSVLVAGQRCPMVGRVCMDQFLADVTAVTTAAEGTVVTLLGTDGTERITADEVAAQAGTISWDVLASLQTRLPRLYIRDGLVVSIA